MKKLQLIFAVLVLAATSYAQSDAHKMFDQVRALEGSWTGKTADGMDVKVAFRPASGGSAVMSEILSDRHGPDLMVTMFHLDNNRLMATHYCSVGNQPRMVASASPDGKSITFTFVDGTNIPTADSGHMKQLAISISDANHHVEEWTFVDHGKEKKEVFTLARAN